MHPTTWQNRTILKLLQNVGLVVRRNGSFFVEVRLPLQLDCRAEKRNDRTKWFLDLEVLFPWDLIVVTIRKLVLEPFGLRFAPYNWRRLLSITKPTLIPLTAPLPVVGLSNSYSGGQLTSGKTYQSCAALLKKFWMTLFWAFCKSNFTWPKMIRESPSSCINYFTGLMNA